MFASFRWGGRLPLLLPLFLATAVAAQQAPIEIHTVVRDAVTGRPLASVEVTAADRRATSDADGHVRIAIQSDTVTLLFRRMGYRPLRLGAGAVPQELTLTPAPILLTGLEVTASAPASEVGARSSLGLTTVAGGQVLRRSETSLASALGEVEGLSSSQPGSWGGKAYLRGLGGERVTVLLDGNRVNRACNFGMDGSLSTISPSSVDRVEVLSGPGSVLYGSGNMGGVINVVTRAAPEDEATVGELRAGASSAVPGGTLGAAFFHRGRRVQFDLAADGAAYDDYRSGRGTVVGSSYHDATLDGRLAVLPGAAHRVQLHVQRYFGREIGYPAMGGTSIPTEDRLLTAVDYGWQLNRAVVDGFSAKAYRQGVDHDMLMSMTMTPPGGSPMTTKTEARTTSVTYGARGDVRLKPWGGAAVTAGIEATEWRADGTRWVTRGAGTPMSTTLTLRAWPDVTVLDAGAFAQGEHRFGEAVALTAGARIDRIVNRADGRPTTFEWVPSGNGGLRVSPVEGVVLRSSLGFGYRIADPTELYGLAPRPDGFIYIGNPDLQTETSRNLEFSAGFTRGRVDAGATVYRNDLSGLITPVLVPDSTILGYAVRQYANLTRARIQGATGRLALTLPARFEARGTLSYTHGENRATSAPLAMIPPLEGVAALRYAPARTLQWVELEAHAAARQARAATGAGEVATPAFTVLNARLMFRLAEAELTLGVDNLFDQAYRQHLDPNGLLRPGRNFYTRIRRTF